MKLVYLLLFLCQIYSGLSKRRRSGNDRFQYTIDDITEPYFISTPEERKAEIGKDVSFYCDVDNMGSSTLIWKKENRIISAGSTIIRKDKRFSLSGYNLTLHDVEHRDEGEYVCEVETYTNPIKQISTLNILIPPTVTPHPKDGKYVVRKGSSKTLECLSTGNPKPDITWTRIGRHVKGIHVPDGSIRIGETLLLKNITRHHGGNYQCTATNGVGPAATAQISVSVLYEPEIIIERHISPDALKEKYSCFYVSQKQECVDAQEDIQAEIYCTVHAEPKPVVRWYKDSLILDPGPNKKFESSRNRHTLKIDHLGLLTLQMDYLVNMNLGVADLGNYSCVAENSLGKEKGYIQISGVPLRPIILSEQESSRSTEYTLKWETVSLLVISEYRILFRPVRIQHDLQNIVEQSSWTNYISTVENKRKYFGQRYDLHQVIFSGSSSAYLHTWRLLSNLYIYIFFISYTCILNQIFL